MNTEERNDYLPSNSERHGQLPSERGYTPDGTKGFSVAPTLTNIGAGERVFGGVDCGRTSTNNSGPDNSAAEPTRNDVGFRLSDLGASESIPTFNTFQPDF